MTEPSISITSSLFRTEKFLSQWQKKLQKFALEAEVIGLHFEVNAIANEPTDSELLILNALANEPWFNLHIVKRESLYASWNRGVAVAKSPICTAWNVDDDRNVKAMLDGVQKIKAGSELIYFPFLYKRYVRIFGLDVLVKRYVVNPPLFETRKFQTEFHCGPFYMFSKSLYEKVGPYDETFRIAGDYDWCVRAASQSTFSKSDIVAGVFEKRAGNLSGGKNPLQAEENDRVLTKSKV